MPTLAFRQQELDDHHVGLLPLVDGESLADLIEAFEHDRGFEPAGGYAGVVRNALPVFLTHGRVALLGCRCGDLACWPLEAAIDVTQDLVEWSTFRQPHRPERAYASFGPFVFERRDYVAAVREAATQAAT